MQLSINSFQLALLYTVEYLPYLSLAVTLLLIIRDIYKRKRHLSTTITVIVTIILFVITRLLAGVI